MMINLSLVAVGGALGACLRYLFGLGVVRLLGHTTIPVGVLGVNVIGSFVMGVFVVMAAHRGLTHLSPLVLTGLLGGFTTFSAFSLEAVTLIERGQAFHAAAYVALSVGLSIAGLAMGMLLARGIFA
jgi:CrcB protein